MSCTSTVIRSGHPKPPIKHPALLGSQTPTPEWRRLGPLVFVGAGVDEQLLGVGTGRGRDSSGQHSAEFLDTVLPVNELDRAHSAPSSLVFHHVDVVVSTP